MLNPTQTDGTEGLDTLLAAHPLLKGAVARPSGEAAVAIEFGTTIDWTIQSRALALADALDALRAEGKADGLIEALPTYRSVLIEYDPERTEPARLLEALPEAKGGSAPAGQTEWSIPVCVEDEMAEDADEMAGVLGLTREEVMDRLLKSVLRVGMYGFVPGFAYCRDLDPTLSAPRRLKPRPPVREGALIVANAQAGFVPRPMPTGWYVLGRTPIRMFDPSQQGSDMVPFAIGDRLRMRAIDRDEFARLQGESGGGLQRFTGP